MIGANNYQPVFAAGFPLSGGVEEFAHVAVNSLERVEVICIAGMETAGMTGRVGIIEVEKEHVWTLLQHVGDGRGAHAGITEARFGEVCTGQD